LIFFYDEAHIGGFGIPHRISKIILAIQLETHGYKWFEGQKNWQAESISLVVDTFLNTVEK